MISLNTQTSNSIKLKNYICSKTKFIRIKNEFLLILLLIYFTTTTIEATQRIVEHPQNTTARLGETIILKCRVENQTGTLQWVKNGFGLGTTRDLPLFDRYNMVGTSNGGEFNLQIKNVTTADDDFYECQISASQTDPSVISKAAKLTILAEPNPPELFGFDENWQQKQPIVATEGVVINLACRSSMGRPAPLLIWVVSADAHGRSIINTLANNSIQSAHPHRLREHIPQLLNQQQLTNKIVATVNIDDDGFSTVTSNLTFFPTKSENGRYITCISKHETYEHETRSASIYLDVFYKPKIRISIDEAKSSIHEGGRLAFICNVDARPIDNLSIKWSWNGEEKRLAVIDSNSAMLTDLKIKDNEAYITCSAKNSIGTESASLKLDIPYGPKFMSINQTKLVKRGESVVFHCEVIGNPLPEVRWFRKDKEDFIAVGKNYTIKNAQDWEAGEYKCMATVHGFPPRNLTHILHLKGPPIVYLNENLIEEKNGAVTLNCEIQSRTLPIKVFWYRNGRLMNFDRIMDFNNRFHIQNLNKDFGLESRLTIQQFTSQDYGLYNCTAQNEFGTNSDQHDIFKRSVFEKIKIFMENFPIKYQLGCVIILICLFVCLLLICCMKCHGFCCHFGKSKSSNFSHDHGDVIVKCETLDGTQFYPELYGNSHLDTSDLICTKDYHSVPQSNPDLDYLPPNSNNFGAISFAPTHSNYSIQNSNDYQINPNSLDYSYQTSYNPAINNIIADMYTGGYTSRTGDYVTNMTNNNNNRPNGITNQQHLGLISPLETLTEVITPDTDGDMEPSMNNKNHDMLNNRPISRVSTHV